MKFAIKFFFPSLLCRFKLQSRKKIEVFFAELSRDLEQHNPLSEWLVVGGVACIPYDIATTCGDFKNEKITKIIRLTELCENDTVVNANKDLMSMIDKSQKLTLVHRCVKKHLEQISWDEPFIKPPSIPRLKLSGNKESCFLMESSDDATTSSRNTYSERRHEIVMQTSFDDLLRSILKPVDSDYSTDEKKSTNW